MFSFCDYPARRPPLLEWLYLDVDCFFASAEQHLRPELRGRPVGIIPVDTLHTGLIAVSREAKARGVRRRTAVQDARAIAPDLVLVPARHMPGATRTRTRPARGCCSPRRRGACARNASSPDASRCG